MSLRRAVLVLLMLGCAGTAAEAQRSEQSGPEQLQGVSTPAGLQVEMTAQLSPLRINQLHGWHIQLLDARGNPVSDATLQISGGMPAHNHGLATEPVISATDRPGSYRLEGMRFHMPGEWELNLLIEWQHQRYQIKLPLRL